MKELVVRKQKLLNDGEICCECVEFRSKPIIWVNWYYCQAFCNRLSRVDNVEYRMPTPDELFVAYRSVLRNDKPLGFKEVKSSIWFSSYPVETWKINDDNRLKLQLRDVANSDCNVEGTKCANSFCAQKMITVTTFGDFPHRCRTAEWTTTIGQVASGKSDQEQEFVVSTCPECMNKDELLTSRTHDCLDTGLNVGFRICFDGVAKP